MKILKRIGLAILGIIALLLITAIFVKKDYSVEREISINKPRQQVFDYIRHVKNQDHYNKWSMADPNAKKEFRGEDGTVGFAYAWDGNDDVGKGEQKIVNIIDGQRIDLDIHFVKPFESDAKAWMTTEGDAQTKVKWGMKGRNPYPLNLLNLLVPYHLGKDLDKSLSNLKNELEK